MRAKVTGFTRLHEAAGGICLTTARGSPKSSKILEDLARDLFRAPPWQPPFQLAPNFLELSALSGGAIATSLQGASRAQRLPATRNAQPKVGPSRGVQEVSAHADLGDRGEQPRRRLRLAVLLAVGANDGRGDVAPSCAPGLSFPSPHTFAHARIRSSACPTGTVQGPSVS